MTSVEATGGSDSDPSGLKPQLDAGQDAAAARQELEQKDFMIQQLMERNDAERQRADAAEAAWDGRVLICRNQRAKCS